MPHFRRCDQCDEHAVPGRTLCEECIAEQEPDSGVMIDGLDDEWGDSV